jgi:hypothetical protein
MNNFEKEAINVARIWNDEGFNKRDKVICTKYLHFPHIRLWDNKFSVFSEEDFLEGFDNQTEKLINEGWDHTVTLFIKPIQSDQNKVHLLLTQSRRDKNDKEYHRFETLWILTKIEGKWGIQFRSSFLKASSQISDQLL